METPTHSRGPRLELNDQVSYAIVKKHQMLVGDRTAGKTLTRIVQAFEHAGMSLVPSPDADAPGSEGGER